MAKLEELTELLVSEIRDFEEAVKRLEEIRKAKITIDVVELNKVLSNHEAELKSQTASVQQVQKQFEKLIKDARTYQKWSVLCFVLSLVLTGTLFLIFYLAWISCNH